MRGKGEGWREDRMMKARNQRSFFYLAKHRSLVSKSQVLNRAGRSRLRIKGDKKRNGARVQFSSRAKSRPSSSYKGKERALKSEREEGSRNAPGRHESDESREWNKSSEKRRIIVHRRKEEGDKVAYFCTCLMSSACIGEGKKERAHRLSS